jgi:hypothetical protein
MRDARWDNLTDAQWDAFAKAWNAELRGEVPAAPLPALPWLLDDPPKNASGYVVPMNFTASPEAQWKFIVAAFASGNESTHGHLAAGPVEHLLGNHGDRYIESFEKMAADDPRFAKMLIGCNKYRMSDEVWRRLCIARGGVG